MGKGFAAPGASVLGCLIHPSPAGESIEDHGPSLLGGSGALESPLGEKSPSSRHQPHQVWDGAPSVNQVLDLMPPWLVERACPIGGPRPLRTDGEFILYWMRTALRGEENPALEAALELSRVADRPVFVYQGLSERYPYASDRHHRFILEGARDVAGQLEARGLGTAFHLEREGHRGPHLATLAQRAVAVVTEDFPVAPFLDWTWALAERVEVPVLAIDTACLVPMARVPWPFERAYEYRRATEEVRLHRLGAPFPTLEPIHPPCVPDLPFEPVELETADFAELLADCAIDHGVAPVAHSRGGTRAGMDRWERFRNEGLRQYHRRRNDPLADGVSRLSAYLHYGMVSPFRIARDAALEGSKGAEKFLDELLVWREMAYAFCYHQPRYSTVEMLPEWARRSLARHEADPRPQLPSWERLARGRTGDALWDAAQTHLLRHGELHNNVRMTWGKALLGWTRNAEEALHRLEDLNHRYALDGRDPASYGGILWCLGVFDRPFLPERPILGVVRPRTTSDHARRFDVGRYQAKTSAPPVADPPRVLVVGAGMSGLACARTLADAGLEVEVVDKGRGLGGRMSTRRIGVERDHPEESFDHGAQYFTARDPRFRTWVEAWADEGVVAPWQGRIGTLEAGRVGTTDGSTERWVAVPGMSTLGRHLASDLEVRTSTRIVALERRGTGWLARGEDGDETRADRVVLALPAPQVVALLPPGVAFAERVAAVRMTPCWAAMVTFEERVDLDLEGAFVSGSPLSWVARGASKPGRPSAESWVLHATAEWSQEHFAVDPDAVGERLLAAFADASGLTLPTAARVMVHRWGFAQASHPLEAEFLFDPATGVGACGDWCPGSRVEGAFLSGVALAGSILRRLTESGRPSAVEPEQQVLAF